jgi:hypothetical protein
MKKTVIEMIAIPNPVSRTAATTLFSMGVAPAMGMAPLNSFIRRAAPRHQQQLMVSDW